MVGLVAVKETMHPLAERFSQRLLERYPEFSSYAQEDGEGNFIVRVPSPQHSNCYLGVVACEDEVIAGFDAGHQHFLEGHVLTEAQAFEQALDLLRSVMAEEVYVIATEREEEPYRFGFRAAGTTGDLEEGERVTYTRSWLGTYDTELGPG